MHHVIHCYSFYIITSLCWNSISSWSNRPWWHFLTNCDFQSYCWATEIESGCRNCVVIMSTSWDNTCPGLYIGLRPVEVPCSIHYSPWRRTEVSLAQSRCYTPNTWSQPLEFQCYHTRHTFGWWRASLVYQPSWRRRVLTSSIVIRKKVFLLLHQSAKTAWEITYCPRDAEGASWHLPAVNIAKIDPRCEIGWPTF